MSESNKSTESSKPVHTLILDAGPIIKNVPPISTLLSQAQILMTTPTVISEIRDPDARQRVETLYLPFLERRLPKPDSLKVVSEFARKTGDREVLSRPDLEILALAYEVECERNGGDWRLKKVPGQKGINGVPPVKEQEPATSQEVARSEIQDSTDETCQDVAGQDPVDSITKVLEETDLQKNSESNEQGNDSIATPEETHVEEEATTEDPEEDAQGETLSDSDDGWITPSNIKKRQARDAAKAAGSAETKTMQVATMTTDFAMQNVLLQMNLNLLSTSNLERIKHLKSYILRCHGCFFTTRDMAKQFCPRCGQPTLNRVSCSTSANGGFQIHLKKNMQWNTRGNKFSIPKPVSGTANGKWKGDGGGKRGWGTELILAPDQKEYVRAMSEESRTARKGRDLMDQDYLPGILTGERSRTGGKIKVGAGRNVNSRKRR